MRFHNNYYSSINRLHFYKVTLDYNNVLCVLLNVYKPRRLGCDFISLLKSFHSRATKWRYTEYETEDTLSVTASQRAGGAITRSSLNKLSISNVTST